LSAAGARAGGDGFVFDGGYFGHVGIVCVVGRFVLFCLLLLGQKLIDRLGCTGLEILRGSDKIR
jgi:hypothetical protein